MVKVLVKEKIIHPLLLDGGSRSTSFYSKTCMYVHCIDLVLASFEFPTTCMHGNARTLHLPMKSFITLISRATDLISMEGSRAD